MILLDGRRVSTAILEKLAERVAAFSSPPKLGVILVGDNLASLSYIGLKRKSCEKIGIGFELLQFSQNVTQAEVLETIRRVNANESFSGLIVQLPLPVQFDKTTIIEAIRPDKDVDGFHPLNVGNLFLQRPTLAPATPLGIMALLNAYDIDIAGKKVVIVGRSNLVGKPLALMMINAGATVTVCNSKTYRLEEITRTAEILVVAAGVKHLIRADMIQTGAVVIDVGNTFEEKQVYGDVDPAGIGQRASFYTPVPGGVGPMTVAMLLSNTVEAYARQHAAF